MALLGIDLGTTFSAVAHLDEHGHPVTLTNAEGELTTPSVVLFDEGGDVVVGREARRAALVEPDRVAEHVKRYMGDPYYPKTIGGRRLSPPAISALILKKLKQDAERKVGKIDGAVITVPAYFDEGRRQATAAAGEMAGLRVIDIINEPTSAALAFAYQILLKEKEANPRAREQQGHARLTTADIAAAFARTSGGAERTVVVYDLGGGTFDVTVLTVKGSALAVRATAGDVRLGGRDWDERLFDHMADTFVRAHGADPRDEPHTRQNLMLTAEEAKKVLSNRAQTRYVVHHAGKTQSGDVTREAFERMTEDLLYRTENRLNRVIRQAQLTWDKVDQVLAVGGSTRMPQVLAMLRRVTGKEPNVSLSPDEAIAHGAAIHAAVRTVGGGGGAGGGVSPAATGPPPLVVPPARAVPPPLPVGAAGEPPPAAATVDEAGGGPAVAASGTVGRFTNRVTDVLRSIRTTNVNAHSLGVAAQLADGQPVVSVLIKQNTQLPVSVRKRFGTVSDNQSVVTVRVVEGESSIPEECIQVGSCTIRGLPPGLPRGSPVEVTFSYDNSGRLHVEAVEGRSGNWATVAIERRSGMNRTKTELEAEQQVLRAKVS